ncbi:MAG: RND transporter, partial [Marinobacter sp. 34-60-7]
MEAPVDWPEQWLGDTGQGNEPSDQWWRAYDDPQLDQWIEQALARNPGLAATAESVIQADLLLENAGADLLPSLRASGSTGRQRSESSDGQSSQRDSTSLGLSLDYELDLWGRLAAAQSGALYERDATRFDYDNARLSLISA